MDLYETDHRRTQYDATQIGSKINAIQKQIGAKKKAKENADDLLEEKKQLEESKKKQEAEAHAKLVKLHAKAKSVGNYVYKDVPVSDNEDNNAVLKTWAPESRKAEFNKEGIPHHGVLARLNGCVDAGVSKCAEWGLKFETDTIQSAVPRLLVIEDMVSAPLADVSLWLCFWPCAGRLLLWYLELWTNLFFCST